MDWPKTLGKLADGADLGRTEARRAMDEIMAGRATPAQAAAFIVALRMKGESVDELTGLVESMRAASVPVHVEGPVVDVVGTGGDRAGTFNISTAAGIVAAAAGARVAKHGNRSASSRAGSADVLEALGYPLDLTPEATATLIDEVGFGFMYARNHHPSMRHAAGVRSELGIPTVFNFLGPLTNPAGATNLAIGVSDPDMAEKMIEVLKNLGASYAFVVFGEDGLDEVSTAAPTFIYRLREGEITHAVFTPEDFGVDRGSLAEVRGGDAEENAAIVRSVLDGEPGPRRDIVLVNAAVPIVAAGLATGFVDGVRVARSVIDDGTAAAKLGAVLALAAELRG
ncbi:MAG: anthranilate phosphoribosyltransferase [Acidimicrobiia bacterium]